MVKGRYVDLILSGKKTATIRLGLVRPRYKEMIVHGGGRPVAKISITKVVYKKVKELTEEDAIKDGFNNLSELLEELKKVYPNISNDDWVTIIEFKVIQRLDQLPVQEPYMGLKPSDLARLGLRYLNNELNDKDKKILLELTRTNSIRMTAINLFGSIEKRYFVRKTLKKVLDLLLRKGIIRGKK